MEVGRDHQHATGLQHAPKDGVPSPRVGQRHKAFGWIGSTVRVMPRNERYIGVWRFKEREWVKVPGTNRRQPRARNASEVMVMQKPELATQRNLITPMLLDVANRRQREG